jgi:hypothetical protein
MLRFKLGKTRQKLDLAAIGRAIKDVGTVLHLGSLFGFHFSVSTELLIVKFTMLHNVARVFGY